MGENTKQGESTVLWSAVVEAVDPNRDKPEVQYEFSGGKKFNKPRE